MSVTVYISSVTIKKEVHTIQNHIQTVLTAKKVPYTIIDIAIDVTKKDEMREKCGNETAVAPQLFNGDVYLGDYPEFQLSVEQDRLMEFLKM